MFSRLQTSTRKTLLLASAALILAVPVVHAQSNTSSTSDRWLHVRVVDTSSKGETVRVNVPLDLAEKVLPTISKDRLHNGKIRIEDAKIDKMNDVDLHAMVDAIRTAKDGEYVTVQGTDEDVRVAKSGGHLIVHVNEKKGNKKSEKSENKSEVEVKIPMKVIDALFSAGKDELDIVAAIHALAAQGDTELVSVKDSENTVRIWLDSKNVSD